MSGKGAYRPYEELSSFQYIGSEYDKKGKGGNVGGRTRHNVSRSGRKGKKKSMDYRNMLKHLLSVSKEIGSSNEKYLIKLAQLTNQSEELRNDNQILVIKVKELEKERNHQYERAEALEQKSATGQIELEEICLKLKNTQHVFMRLKKLQSEKIALLQYSHSIAEEKSKLVSDVEELKRENGQHQETIQVLTEKLSGTEKLNTNNEQRLEHFMDLEKKNLGEYNTLKEEYQKLVQEHDEVRQAKTQIEFVQEELLQAIKDVKIENETLIQQEVEYKTKVKKYEQDDERKELVIHTLQKEVKTLQQQIEEGRDLQDTNEQNRVELSSLKQQLIQREEKIEEQEERSKQTIESYRTQVEELQFQLSKEKGDHTQLQKDYDEIRQSHLNLIERHKNLEGVHHERSSTLETAIQKSERSVSEIVSLKEQVRQRDERIERLSEYVNDQNDMESEVRKLRKQNLSLREKYESLHKLHTEHTDALESSSHQMESERQQILSLQSEIVTLKDHIEQRDETIDTLQKEKLEESELLHSKVTELEENLESLKSRTDNEVKKAEDELSKRTTEQETTNLDLKRQLISVEGEKEKILIQFEKLKQAHESSARSLKDTNQKTKEFLERKIGEKNEKISSLSQQISHLTEEMDDKMREGQVAMVTLSRLKTKLSEMKLKRNNALKINENTHRQNNNLMKEISDWKRKCESLSKQLKKYSKQISKISQMKSQLKSSYDVIQMLRKTNKELSSQFENNTSVVQNYEEKISQLEYDKGLEKRVLNSEIDHLKNINSQLSNKIKSITNHNLSVLSNTKLEF